MLERATQKGTSDIVFSCHQSLVSKGEPASSRQRIAQLTCAQLISDKRAFTGWHVWSESTGARHCATTPSSRTWTGSMRCSRSCYSDDAANEVTQTKQPAAYAEELEAVLDGSATVTGSSVRSDLRADCLSACSLGLCFGN